MFLYLISSLIISLSLTFFFNSSPINIGLWVLLLAMAISSFMSFMIYPWFGLILFLVYISGLLVMFSYFAAISPNQYMTPLPWKIFLTLFMPVFLLSMFLLIHTSSPISKIKIMFTPLFSKMNMSIFIFLGIILFITLIAVVKIAFLWKGPLRPYSMPKHKS